MTQTVDQAVDAYRAGRLTEVLRLTGPMLDHATPAELRLADQRVNEDHGIDYTVHNPQFDPHIWQKYDWNALDRTHKNKRELQKLVGLEQRNDIPLVGLVHRPPEQNGFELITQALPILQRLPLQMLIVGTGDRDYITVFKKAAKNDPNKIGIFTPQIGSDVNDEHSSRVYAGSDMFLMPSRWEPCGLNQMYSLRYGTPPVVHAVGGLNDTVTPNTGFTFAEPTAEALQASLAVAIETWGHTRKWRALQRAGMKMDFSWDRSAREYVKVYEAALGVG
jgi:starch synthase